MKPIPVFVLFVLFLAAACNTKKPAANSSTAQASDTAKFYPLHSFFKDQIQYVDLRNFSIYRVTTIGDKRDSVPLSKEQFIELAQIFLTHALTEPGVKALYRESVFHDLSTGSVTLNYSPTDPNAEVQNIDILLDESTNLVKRVFIRCLHIRGDTTLAEQCNWKANKSFQVNRSIATKGSTSTELNYINWNDKP